jgi:hypothetical protein
MWSQFQAYIFEQIKTQLPDGVSFAKTVSGLLNGNLSNTYKKLRGEVPISGEEALLLLQHFGISADRYVFAGQGSVVAEYTPLTHPVSSPEDYLQALYANLLRVRQIPTGTIWYASASIPIFSFLSNPLLTAFKLFMWSRLNWGIAELQQQPFDPTSFWTRYPKIEPLRVQIMAMYQQIDSYEFWPTQASDNLLGQIRYMSKINGFQHPHTAFDLLAEIQQMLHSHQHMAIQGRKTDGLSGQFLLYLNEIIAANNSILIRSGEQPLAAFVSVDNPSFMSFRDPRLLLHMDAWMQNIRMRTMRVSGENEQYRAYLFGHLEKRRSELVTELRATVE